jgi:hypothetical protein
MGILTSILHPEGFHGHGKRKRFFEGWYIKLVSADRSQRWAVIPGVFLSETGGGEAFVQVLDGTTRRSWYHRYPLHAFEAKADRFEARVGPNHFSSKGLSLALESGPLTGELRFSTMNPWPVRFRSPGIMGPFSYVPFMECYHGIVSFHHSLRGTLNVEGRMCSFDGGHGYLEKDWGEAFPSGYIWMQSNHFPDTQTSLMASAAIVPWLTSSFPGFIAGLWREGTLYRFATYTGAMIEHLEVNDSHVEMVFSDRQHRLSLRTTRQGGGVLHAPVRSEMHKRVEESLDATIEVRLSTTKGRTLFEERGSAGGLEVHGQLDRLMGMAKKRRNFLKWRGFFS